jgi:hypothetical protein
MIDKKNIVLGQWADYFDTGIWSRDEHGQMVAPDDLTIAQLKDFLVAGGGAVYLRRDRKLVWINAPRAEEKENLLDGVTEDADTQKNNEYPHD